MVIDIFPYFCYTNHSKRKGWSIVFYQTADNLVTKKPYTAIQSTNPALYSGFTPARPFTIRLATQNDKLSIIRSAQKKQTDYMTTTQLCKDIDNNSLIITIDNAIHKIVGWCALDFACQQTHGYCGIKRMMIPNKKYRKRGIASLMIQWIIQEYPKLKFGGTPWIDNFAMRKVLADNGFTLSYYFGENDMWCCYTK